MKNSKYIFITILTFLMGISMVSAQTSSGTILPPPNGGNAPESYDTDPNLEKQERDRGMLRPASGKEGEEVDQNEDTTKKEPRTLRARVEAVREELKELREGTIEKMQELKEKIKAEKNKAKAKIKEEIVLGREQALERFDTAIKKVEESKERVEKQVIKMESQGIVIKDEIKNLSINAESKLNEARGKVVEINSILAKSLNQLSKEDKTKINTLTKETQQTIKDAQKMLNEEVFELRKIINPSVEPIQPPSPEIPTTETPNSTSNQ